MTGDDLLARALELADRAAGGLVADEWRMVRDASKLLRQRLNGRQPTAKERWLLDTGERVSRWLGPAPGPNSQGG